MAALGKLNERAILIEEAVNEIKSGKAPGLDGFLVACLMKYGMSVYSHTIEWLARLFNEMWNGSVRMPSDTVER